MRFNLILISALSLACTAMPLAAHAQISGGTGSGGRGGPGSGGGGPDEQPSQDDAKKRRLDREMQTQALPLPPVKADGPCPYVKILYDAARTIEFKDNKQASTEVAWSGEIEGLIADCSYKDADPIKVQTNITFLFGRGPQAQGQTKTFTYWVAVTERDKTVIDKEYFTINATFPAGQDRVTLVDPINAINIPRAKAGISGSNFEILIGFDVTPDMAAFNRLGARFKVNAAGETTNASVGATKGTPAAR